MKGVPTADPFSPKAVRDELNRGVHDGLQAEIFEVRFCSVQNQPGVLWEIMED